MLFNMLSRLVITFLPRRKCLVSFDFMAAITICSDFGAQKSLTIFIVSPKVDDFLELSCFLYDSVDVGNLISGSSAFSKSSLNIWKLSVHILLKPRLAL